MHKVTREGDEKACTCGLRWGVNEEDPHNSPRVYDYKVIAEEYDGSKFIGLKEFSVQAVHCSVAAQQVERFPNFYVVSSMRYSEYADTPVEKGEL